MQQENRRDIPEMRLTMSLAELTMEQIYQSYYDRILRYIQTKLSSPQEAEDICSAVMLKIMNGLPNFQPSKSSLTTWIYTITRNAVTDHFRGVRLSAPLEETISFHEEGFDRILREETLEELAATGCESYYRGPLMEKIVAFSQATGGYFCEDDFRNYKPEWVEPISTDYKGYTVCEIPPNGHGITVLMALNLLKGLELSGQKDCADTYHKILESIKLAFADTKTYVADPRYMRTRVEDLLSEEYAARRRALISEQALTPEAGDPSCGGTIYLCTADPQGNMVSFIQSNYTTFGAGVAIPGTGISLQNRGANFSLDEGSDNCLAGGKRSYHTIIPGFLMRDGEAVGPFGVMGAFMQPQGHVLVVVNTVDYHMNPQEAMDAPRIQWTGGKHIQLEREVPAHIAQELARRGHEVEIVNSNLHMGRGQIIWKTENGLYIGGTEPRCDGTVAAW